MSRKSAKKPAWLYLALLVLLAALVVALLLPDDRQGAQVQHTAVIDAGAGKASPGRITNFAYEELNDQYGLVAPVETKPPAHYGIPQTGIALVMDDVGYDLQALDRIIALPFPVAISVLPDSPHASDAASIAYNRGEVVMLHLPMEPTTPKYREKMDSSFLRSGMSKEEIQWLVTKAMEQVPYATGINNHMGSLLTTQEEPMRWVMELCKSLSLFFIDSKTTGNSVAADVAAEQGVDWASRRVFLDHSVDAGELRKAWDKAVQCARSGQSCIVIGHPHAETLDFLEKHVTEAERELIKPVTSMLHGGAS